MDLLQAVTEGNVEEVRSQLIGASRTAVDKRGPNKSTALMVAASLGNVEIAAALIGAGASLDLQDSDEQTALMYAICQQNDAVVDLLLDAGARADIENWRAFDFAVRFGTPPVVKRLLELGADVNRREDDDATPFLEAVNRGNREMVQLLVDAGADIMATAHGGQTAISLAASSRHPDLFDYLVEMGCPIGPALNGAVFTRNTAVVKRLLELGADVNEQDKQFGYSPLSTAADCGDAKLAKLLLDAGADPNLKDSLGQTPIWSAAMGGHAAVMKLLLDTGADMNLRNGEGETLLTTATWMEEVKAVDLLLSRGADPNESGKNSPAPLLWAAVQGSLPMTKRLLQAGADPNATVPKTSRTGFFEQYPPGTTALMIAAAENRGKLVDALIEAGADPNAKNSKDETASGYASKKGHSKILARLENAGVTIDRSSKKLQDAILVQAAEGKNLAEAKKALAAGATADATSERGGPTPLMTAALEGHAGMVKTLLDAGADVNRVSKWGQSPLRNAVVRGHLEVVRLLIQAGADANLEYEPASIPAEKQNTVYPSMDSPLADAVTFGHSDILDALIEAGADVNRVSKSGTTPLLAAVWGRQFDLARRLIAAGAKRREEDEDYLAVLDWDANAQAEAFQESIREVAETCGSKPEPVDWLPGGVSFRFTVPNRKEKADETEDRATAALNWSKRFNEEYGSLAKRVDDVLGELAKRIDARGYHLLDAGMPLGCGPMTRFMVLAPTNNKYALMGTFGVRGNDMELTNQDIIRWFREFETKAPFKLRGCKFDTVIVELEKPLPNPKKWAKTLGQFCPDSFYSDSEDCVGPNELVEALRTATKLHFWWD